jgi:GNAT superfamily N-acetyltransferase
MIFREATAEDISALSEVRLSVRENVLSNPELITREMYQTYLCETGKGWLCEVNDEVVGFCIASRSDASIWALFVKPTDEKRGIGKILLHLATNWLFEKGATSISLTTAASTRADTFYQRQGWKRGKMKSDIEVCYTLNRPK